jgi:excisionase family DNA binding protein
MTNPKPKGEKPNPNGRVGAAPLAGDLASFASEPGADSGAEPFISKREVARRLERTPRTVEGLMRRGIIPYYKLGYRVAFRWSEIQEHLAQTCRVFRGRQGR